MAKAKKKVAANRPAQNPALRARQIAEKAKPHLRAVEVAPVSDELIATADATVPDLEHAQRKYGKKNASRAPAKELHMVTMEPKRPSDAGPKRHTVIVDDEKVVGESDQI
jgi:hypothetical protein